MKSLTSSSTNSLSSLSGEEKEKKMSRREEVSRNREERQREKEGNLTFRPTLKKSASAIALAEENEASLESRFDRLYSEAKKRKDTELERNNVNTYSFKPTITAKGKKRSSTPEGTSKRLYEAPGAGKPRRSSSVDKSKERSFSPQITSRARSMERSAGGVTSPATRLYSEAQTRRESREALASKIIKETSKECTFSPKTNSESKTNGVPVEKRMEKYLELREKRIQALKEKQLAQESQNATFKPNSFTKGRTPSAERVRKGDVPARTRPAVPRADKEKDAPPTVFDRLTNATPQQSKKKVVVHVDKEEKELTFKPNLVTKRAASVSSY